MNILTRRKTSVGTKQTATPPLCHYGCEHYSRKCAFVPPCCGKIYVCRVCHDNIEDHKMERRDVTRIQCLICFTFQEVGQFCNFCNVEFGHYFCAICRMYDDTDKKQFHCSKCGLCRVGGQENFFHCDKCDMCMCKDLEGSHKCIEKATHRDCPVCLEDLHTATTSLHVMACGHVTHEKCWFEMLRKGFYECPLCGHSMLNLESVWRRLDAEIARNPMPEELRNTTVRIHCKDCSTTSQTFFHRVGLKCTQCGSYNTDPVLQQSSSSVRSVASSARNENVHSAGSSIHNSNESVHSAGSNTRSENERLLNGLTRAHNSSESVHSAGSEIQRSN